MNTPGNEPGSASGQPPTPALPASGGRLTENIMHFARVLRAAGLPVGPGRVLQAIRAVETVGVSRRDDFYWSLFSVFVNRQDQCELFDQAFHVFWRNPRILEQMMSVLLPQVDVERDEEAPGREVSRRLSEALFPGRGDGNKEGGEQEVEIDASFTFSDREVLQKLDFEAMSSAELAIAKAAIRRLRLPIVDVPIRRMRPNPRGRRIDMRSTMRAALRATGTIPLKRRSRRRRHPPLVVICDISGSMSRYSRMFLHFMHAITNDRDRVHTFTFGTRLTNVTRFLRHRDVDIALSKVSDAVQDWSGGTRIGVCLKDFNAQWSRRVLSQGAIILVISDGLDRDAGEGINKEMERLHKSCRRLIWLNPLLRYEGFEPKSRGVRAMLPHVDDFRTVHNLESLTDLAAALAHPVSRREEPSFAMQETG